jgi:hypothetical protein
LRQALCDFFPHGRANRWQTIPAPAGTGDVGSEHRCAGGWLMEFPDRRGAAATLLLGLALAMPAVATERLDIQVGTKALPLLTNKMSGDVPMAVVYDPANAESKTDAEGIKKVVDDGIDVPGGIKLSAMLVGVGELSKLSTAKIAFLTPGLSAHFDAIGAAAAGAGVLTISTDVDCVKAGKCIIGVVTKPSVTIYFSKAASEAAKISFSQAFIMLVKQP